MPEPDEQLTMSCPAEYRICVQSVIDLRWAAAFAPMRLSHRDTANLLAGTVITGRVPDQAALLGPLNPCTTLACHLSPSSGSQGGWPRDAYGALARPRHVILQAGT
jgi:hypothetical protein